VEIPPLDVAGGELHLGGTLIRKLAVDVVEPEEVLVSILLGVAMLLTTIGVLSGVGAIGSFIVA